MRIAASRRRAPGPPPESGAVAGRVAKNHGLVVEQQTIGAIGEPQQAVKVVLLDDPSAIEYETAVERAWWTGDGR